MSLHPVISASMPRLLQRSIVCRLIVAVVACLALHGIAAGEEDVPEARALIKRVLPDQAGRFDCQLIPDEEGRDVFEIEPVNDRIVIRGNSGVSLAMGFNWYLREVACASYDWQAAGPLHLTGPLPLPAGKVRHSCLAKERFFLNYCTFGYTFPFTQWDGWQRVIDWMAMNGINRPLLQAGQEAVWLRVWESYGLKEPQILAYFSGPAHLPWHRMANLDAWGGPLPMSYVNGQMELQKKILARARALGMKPILSGFAGHVPEALKQIKPEAKITRIKPGWGGMEAKYATWFLDPGDALFTDIQTRFIKEQSALYGTDHLYACDPFNEITPPSWEPSYMASVGKSIYDGMTGGDPAAIWYQMSWTFEGEWLKKSPSGETPLSAIVKAVPAGRMVILDYVCEEKELYRKTESFSGAPFIWNYLANFGGCTYMLAPLDSISSRIATALPQPNCLGVGSTLEGLGINPVGYDLTFEQPWLPRGTADTKSWLAGYATRRAGRADPHVIKAWAILAEKILQRPRGHFDRGSAITQAPAFDMKKDTPAPKTALAAPPPPRDPALLEGYAEALAELFLAAPESQEQDGFRYDAVNWLRQLLAYHSDNVHARMMAAFRDRDLPRFQQESVRFLGIIRDMDVLVGTRHEYLLGSWIRDARSWGTTPKEADYYEANARQILTSWHKPGGGLGGYARREWNGLLASYYLPRWEKYIDGLGESLKSGQPYDFNACSKWMNEFDARWVASAGEVLATGPQGDSVKVARGLFEKYRSELAVPVKAEKE